MPLASQPWRIFVVIGRRVLYALLVLGTANVCIEALRLANLQSNPSTEWFTVPAICISVMTPMRIDPTARSAI
jgi:hypothetical protein